MKVLVCGAGKSAFREFLVSRLNREKHEVFVLTGNKEETEKREKGIFQSYAFPYTEDGVSRVIGNISPDMVVFLGAMDSNFEGEWEKSEVVYYISSLTNILMCAKNSGAKKFVYLSTLDIFKNNKESSIDAETVPVPVEAKEKAILQGEEICRFYQSQEFPTYVLRMGTVYGGFGKYVTKEQVVEPLITAIEEEETIDCIGTKNYFVTALADAVDAVCRLMFPTEYYEQTLTVPGMNVTKEKLVQELAEILGKEAHIQISEKCEAEKHFFFEVDDIYGFKLKYDLKEGLQQYIKQRKNQKSEKQLMSEIKKPGKNLDKVMPFIETLVGFLLVWAIQSFHGDIWILDSIDFCLLYVTLIAAVHGTNCGLLALVLSVLVKFSIDIQAQGLEIVAMDYTKYTWVLQILIVSVLVGFMRDKYWRKSQDLDDELQYCQSELVNLEQINESNVYVKNEYEKRLINYKNSMARIYDITSKLDIMDSRRAAFQAIDVVEEVMNCSGVTIYTRSGEEKYFRMLASDTTEYKKLGKSICYNKEFPMYEMLEEEGIYRNRKMEANLPVMAGAISDSIGTQTIVMIWSLELENVNQYQINLFRVLNRLIEKTMHRANQYMEELYRDAYFPNTKIMKSESLKELLDIYEEGANWGVFEYAVLKIEKHSEITGNEWLIYLNGIHKLLRDIDSIGVDEAGNGLIVLGATGQQEVPIVQKRLTEQNVHSVYCK